ncbi:MAG: hypothetical protein H7320_11555 [Ferruginibacter sp.]|nr:hypothetical protein [Ferruginibacter sp.]
MATRLDFNENYTHVSDLIKRWIHPGFREEALEFLEACKKNVQSIQGDLETDITNLEEKVEDLENEVRELQENFVDFELFETENLGIGKIEYRTDNLKLQSKMHDFIIELKN